MKIGHEEASENEKADFTHSLTLKHFAEWSKYSDVTVVSLKGGGGETRRKESKRN